MNSMGLFEAETFLVVAECGGFGAAARELGVTQSTISRRIATLEARLAAHDCLALRTYAPRTTWQVVWHGEPVELRFTPRMTVSDVYALLDLCGSGLGVAVLPMYAADAPIANRTLVNAAPGLSFTNLDVFAAYARDRAKLPKVAAVLDELRRLGSGPEPTHLDRES